MHIHNPPINEKKLKTLYIEEGFSDSEIANMIGVSRSYISHIRRQFNIPTRVGTGRVGELIAMIQLLSEGFAIKDLNATDKTAPYDILVDGELRIDVKSAKISSNGRFVFSMANKSEGDHIKTKKIKTSAGRLLKDYSKSCDYLMFICLRENPQIFIIPSNEEIVRMKSTINIKSDSDRKFDAFKNNWSMLKGANV